MQPLPAKVLGWAAAAVLLAGAGAPYEHRNAIAQWLKNMALKASDANHERDEALLNAAASQIELPAPASKSLD